ncbi:MAG: GNAT family protein [Nocardioidaceae bacterium]
MPRTLADVSWPIRTERLVIRPATAGDAESTWRYRRLDEVSTWLSGTPSTYDGYAARFADHDRLTKTLVVELDGTVVGDLYIALEDGWAQAEVAHLAVGVQAEIGWALDPAVQGRGLATEAVTALIRTAFTDLGLRRVYAQCFADNEASWRLMERVGMRRESHTLRESLHRSGAWRDGMAYALLADEWPP